jgi:hypothetical protein
MLQTVSRENVPRLRILWKPSTLHTLSKKTWGKSEKPSSETAPFAQVMQELMLHSASAVCFADSDLMRAIREHMTATGLNSQKSYPET